MNATTSLSPYLIQHNEAEENVIKELLSLEQHFRQHHDKTLEELGEVQKKIVKRIWYLTQRYMALQSTGKCCKFPEVYAIPATNAILGEYHERFQELCASNCRISHSVHKLRRDCLKFEDACKQLDMSAKSAVILGDAYHQPIAYFIEVVSDIFKYFHAHVLKLKAQLHQLEPGIVEPLQKYDKLIEPSEEFNEYFSQSLMYCQALQPKKKCAKTPTKCTKTPTK